TPLKISYSPQYVQCVLGGHREALPTSAASLDDGRIVARYQAEPGHPGDRTVVYRDRLEFAEAHPFTDAHRLGPPEPVEAPPLAATFVVEVDWAEIHHFAAEIDRARFGSDIGRGGGIDAFGGTYSW